MSDTAASLSRKIGTAGDLQSVVRTMKAVAASSIGQYESAVHALDDYCRTVQLGLAVCLRQSPRPVARAQARRKGEGTIAAVVFGSDQGLVGQLNDVMADFVLKTLGSLPGRKIVWAVGERIESRFTETDLLLGQSFILPGSIGAIAPLVGQLLIELETLREKGEITQVYVFHSRPHAGAVYIPGYQRLLPLDEAWQHDLTAIPWPGKNLPQVINGGEVTLRAFVREYLFVSLFRACAESLASENASRLAAMQRAEKNIDELLENLNRSFHRLRQSGIDEELFDVISGFESLTRSDPQRNPQTQRAAVMPPAGIQPIKPARSGSLGSRADLTPRKYFSPMKSTIEQLLDLKGKTAVVTGDSRGPVRQLAQAFGKAGAKVRRSSHRPEGRGFKPGADFR